MGTGQIGTFALRHLRAAGHPVVAADAAPDRAFVDRYAGPGVHLHSVDMRDPAALDGLFAAAGAIDTVVAAAGLTGARAAADPESARTTAVDGVTCLLDAAARHGVARAILVSSLAVYDARPGDTSPLAEDTAAIRPATPYGRCLAAMERAIRDRGAGPACTLLRVAGVFGPNRFGHGSHSSRLVERMVYSAALGTPLRLTGLRDDCDDMIYVRDVARAIAAATTRGAGAQTVNVATGGLTRLDALAAAVAKVFGDLDLTLDPPVPARAPLNRPPLDVTRMTGLLGPPAYDLAAAVADFAELADLAPARVGAEQPS
jgi:nucleoside-diphosphate-sugar epimerase